jgi:TRAP-type uncharacterized transport system fused permease subunit
MDRVCGCRGGGVAVPRQPRRLFSLISVFFIIALLSVRLSRAYSFFASVPFYVCVCLCVCVFGERGEGFARLLQGCCKGVARVLQGCYKNVTCVLQGCHKGVTRMLQVCHKGVRTKRAKWRPRTSPSTSWYDPSRP